MSKASRVAEPVVLASYNLHPRSSSTWTRRRHVYAHIAPSKADFVSLAVQGDGVHIIDTSSMHSVASYTLGPSVAFACAPQSCQLGAGPLTTIAAVDINDSCSEIYSFTGNSLDQQEGTSQLKKAQKIQHCVYALHVCSDAKSSLLVITRDAQVLLVDADLTIIKETTSTSPAASVRKSFVFNAASCDFLPAAARNGTKAVIVMFVETDNILSIRLFTVDKDDEISEPIDCELSNINQDLADISFDPSGYSSVLTTSGALTLYMLEAHEKSFKLSERIRTVDLSRDLKFSSASLLAMGDSFVLLACSKTSSSDIVTLLWDLRYSAVLGQFTRPLPTNVSPGDGNISLHLAARTPSQAILVVSPVVQPSKNGKRKASSNALRSVVFSLPCFVPTRSSIAAVLGQATAAKKWILSKPSVEQAHTGSRRMLIEKERGAMLKALGIAMVRSTKEAVEKIFFDWLAVEKSILVQTALERNKRKSEKVTRFQKSANESQSVEDVSQYNDAAKSKQVVLSEESHSTAPALNYKLVTGILRIIMPEVDDTRSRPYPTKIMDYFASHVILSHSMIEGGLFDALLARGDWVHITQFLRDKIVPDVPEATLIRLLKVVMTAPRKVKAGKDSMEIDLSANGFNNSKMPQLSVFLGVCISYPTSPPALRAAMREHLTNVDDIAKLLNILDSWIASWSSIDDIGFQLDPERAHSAETRDTHRDGLVARFAGTMSFLQALLDATFLILVQHPPLQTLLRRLHEHVLPEVELFVRLEALRGPLEQFSRHIQHQKAAGSKTGKGKREHRSGYRRIGAYQVEQLSIRH